MMDLRPLPLLLMGLHMSYIARSIRLHPWCIRIAAILITLMLAAAGRAQTATNGLIMLIEFEKIEGVRHWESELDQRGLTALIQAQHNVLTEYPKDFERLATKGYPIAGLYAEKPFWDVPYDDQYARMREAKEAVEQITHKPMRLFGSRYILPTMRTHCGLPMRSASSTCSAGDRRALATIRPARHKAKIISVSNVPFGRWAPVWSATHSLWARGSTDQDFAAMVDKVIASRQSH